MSIKLLGAAPSGTTDATTKAYVDAPRSNRILSTLGNTIVAPTANASVGVANDLACFGIVAEATETWKHLLLQTGSTFSGTANMDIGIIDGSSGSRLWHAGAATENTVLGTPGTSSAVSLAINGTTGVSVTAGNLYYIAFYMASASDGFRGANGILQGATFRNTNQLICGKLASQTGVPASITISSLVAIGYIFAVAPVTY